MSKNIWLVPLTIILFVVPETFGITTACEPSFGVPATKVIGKVKPPSVDNKISTFIQFIPLALVPATVQLIVWDVPAAKLVVVFWVSTVNGPDMASTVTITSSLLFAPPPTLLSLTVNLKFKVLATAGNVSEIIL